MDFLNNNAGLVTLLAALVAFGVYSKQKWDTKRDIANSILLEIQGAENNLKKAKETLKNTGSDSGTESIAEDVVLMPNESWSKYRQYFVRDFDRDEWDAIGEFYSLCNLYDIAATNNHSAFARNEEQIRANAHRLVADYADEMGKKVATLEVEGNEQVIKKAYDEYNSRERFVRNSYLTSTLSKPMYAPQKYLDQAILYTSSIKELSLTSVGTRLKKITRRGWLRNLFHLYSG